MGKQNCCLKQNKKWCGTLQRRGMMNKIASAIIILCFLCSTANAYEIDKWDKKDIALAAAAVVSLGMDWRQTKYIADHPESCREKNFILGSHPSNNDVDVYFAATTVIVLTAAHLLPSTWRKVLLGGVVLVQVQAIGNNIGTGIGIRW